MPMYQHRAIPNGDSAILPAPAPPTKIATKGGCCCVFIRLRCKLAAVAVDVDSWGWGTKRRRRRRVRAFVLRLWWWCRWQRRREMQHARWVSIGWQWRRQGVDNCVRPHERSESVDGGRPIMVNGVCGGGASELPRQLNVPFTLVCLSPHEREGVI